MKIDNIDLSQQIWDLNNELTQSIRLLRKNGTELAERERDYKIKLRTEALKLRQDEKIPVTLIAQIIYGVPEVADLRFKRDVAEATYNANQEHIASVKLQIRLMNAQLAREWGIGNGDF